VSDGAREHEGVATPEPAGTAAPVPAEVAPAVATLLRLQRAAGNAAVGSLLAARGRALARAPALPGFSQAGDTCGAASLVTALFVWDAERGSGDNAAVVHACDLVLTANDKSGVNATAIAAVKSVRALAMTPGHKLGQKEYESLGMALALLYNGRAGMSEGDINALARGIGLRPGADGSGQTLAQILATDAVTQLKPGEVGQLNWVIAATGAGHAMLLGRHEDGTWFFSDQGPPTPREIQRANHADLTSAILSYASTGSWLYSGNKLDLPAIPPYTGFKALGHIQAFLNRGPSLITPGEKLAEIDAGVGTTGEVITAWDYRSRHDTLAEAKDAIAKDKGGHGGVIVERPKGMFHIYKTNPISNAKNLKETTIDASDSAGMVLVKRIKSFYSVWVVLSDASGNKSTPFEVPVP
jgi:hypothetical protein